MIEEKEKYGKEEERRISNFLFFFFGVLFLRFGIRYFPSKKKIINTRNNTLRMKT